MKPILNPIFNLICNSIFNPILNTVMNTIFNLVGELQANCLSLVEPQLNPSLLVVWATLMK